MQCRMRIIHNRRTKSHSMLHKPRADISYKKQLIFLRLRIIMVCVSVWVWGGGEFRGASMSTAICALTQFNLKIHNPPRVKISLHTPQAVQ
jgi:hypothetical protein